MDVLHRTEVARDGTVVVWVGAWQVKFPVEKEPEAHYLESAQPPADHRDETVARVVRAGDGFVVGCLGKVVLLRPDGSWVLLGLGRDDATQAPKVTYTYRAG